MHLNRHFLPIDELFGFNYENPFEEVEPPCLILGMCCGVDLVESCMSLKVVSFFFRFLSQYELKF